MAKFLIVDDDSDDREMFCEALRDVDSDSVCFKASGGRRAIMLLDNKEIEIPDLIFLDINMPVMSGWECLLRLKQAEDYQSIPVIIYSTSSYPEDVEKARRLGALCFFSKPFSFKELKSNLALVLHYLSSGSLACMVDSSARFSTG